MINRQHAFTVVLLVVGLLSLAALACSSDQEWIIPRTITPTPTRTPVPLEVESLYNVGDQLAVVGTGAPFVFQTVDPEADTGRNRVIGSPCFPDQNVTVLEVAEGADGALYYYVHCVMDGWLPETLLRPLE